MAGVAAACLLFAFFGFSLTVSPGGTLLLIIKRNPVVLFVSCLMAVIFILAMVLLFLLPTKRVRIFHAVPCVPFVPLTSILFNIYLLTNLSRWTWARFAVWMFLGKYLSTGLLGYHCHHSSGFTNLQHPHIIDVPRFFVCNFHNFIFNFLL